MSLRSEIGWAVRAARRNPALSLAVTATLALGIGVNTSVFSVVYGVLLRPLPYEEPEELVRVWLNNTQEGIERDITSYPNMQAWRERSRSLEYVASANNVTLNLVEGGEPEELIGTSVSEGWFEMLGVAPALGRTFSAQEADPMGTRAVVLSHGLWSTRFGRDPGVVGRSIELSGNPYPVVGVMPSGFGDVSFWIPLQFTDRPQMRENRGALWLPVYGRLADGVTVERAQADMDAVAARLAEEYPQNEGMGVLIELLHASVVGEARPGLLVLLGAVVLVLLIACANIANLLLARGTGRRREMAVRVALGAGRGRLSRQVLVESLVLAGVGGLIGVALSLWGSHLLAALAPSNLPRLGEVRADGPVLAFGLLSTALAGVLFGLAPAWQVARRDPAPFLAEGGRGNVGGANRLRPALVIGQFALALMLLAGAGLLLRSFINLLAVDRGFDTRRVLSTGFSIPAQRYAAGDPVRGFFDALVAAAEATPGVESAGLISTLFLNRLPQMAPMFVEGNEDAPETIRNTSVAYDAVSPGLLGTLRMRLTQGRGFAATDHSGAPSVAIVNEHFVELFLNGRDPIGHRFAFGQQAPASDEDWITIVGVSAETRRSGLDQRDRPSFFLPFAQYSPRRLTLLVRTSGDPVAFVPALRDIVRRIDPQQPISAVRTVDESIARSIAPRRFIMLLLGVFAACATLLAAVGIYGVMAYAVGRRTREIGVRMALGARQGQVMSMVVGQALRHAGLGLLLGLAGALALGRLIRGQLFGVSGADPLTLGAVALLLAAVATLASWLPARRAAAIHPLEALRSE